MNKQLTRTQHHNNAYILGIVLGLLGLMGIGHMYLGKIPQGTAFLIIGLIFVVITFVEPITGIILSVIMFMISIITLRAYIKQSNTAPRKTTKTKDGLE